MTAKLFLNNDHLINLKGLLNNVTGNFSSTATVTVRLKDKLGADVAGIVWPITLTFINGSNGDYQGVLDKAVSIVKGEIYFAEITAIEGSIDAFWRLRVQAEDRIT